ncbi:hypothetical protein V5799_015009 [Amblyomma americanum]|uniref:Uncharacterized protein n=1 Tax=Amblyomma americanum TaxID=6943 RepID=A0AAQ4E1D6_AMBAM
MTTKDLEGLRSALSDLSAAELANLDDVTAPWRSSLPRLRGLPRRQVHDALCDALQTIIPYPRRVWLIACVYCWAMTQWPVSQLRHYCIESMPSLDGCVALIRDLESLLLANTRSVLAWNEVEGTVHCCLLIPDQVSSDHNVVYACLRPRPALLTLYASEKGIQGRVLTFLRALLHSDPQQVEQLLSDNQNTELFSGLRRLGQSSPQQPGGALPSALQEAPAPSQGVGRGGRKSTVRTDGDRLDESSPAQGPDVAPGANTPSHDLDSDCSASVSRPSEPSSQPEPGTSFEESAQQNVGDKGAKFFCGKCYGGFDSSELLKAHVPLCLKYFTCPYCTFQSYQRSDSIGFGTKTNGI